MEIRNGTIINITKWRHPGKVNTGYSQAHNQSRNGDTIPGFQLGYDSPGSIAPSNLPTGSCTRCLEWPTTTDGEAPTRPWGEGGGIARGTEVPLDTIVV